MKCNKKPNNPASVNSTAKRINANVYCKIGWENKSSNGQSVYTSKPIMFGCFLKWNACVRNKALLKNGPITGKLR